MSSTQIGIITFIVSTVFFVLILSVLRQAKARIAEYGFKQCLKRFFVYLFFFIVLGIVPILFAYLLIENEISSNICMSLIGITMPEVSRYLSEKFCNYFFPYTKKNSNESAARDASHP